ncbi:N-hydroxyarylamine O-acetyltransferase [Sphingomonas vulcanisoli]|uniref:N-hydroxyarylamine O-acetyltransferase n=1 Tax=Sphingomonas vulcanisoli TaxID=1658060 RepID=A0ABX0TXD1_9SPHN|nr:arylamine N-acetyltransferase [Sphingomonas vulcanisoli]NIJ09102.1 N-hydroxyarylamine O-acetyltransferase [Sphingomonas vulcanisoli]
MFDLEAYLARTRLPLAPTPDAEGLAILQRAHRLAIPFENLDIALGRGIAIDSDSVFAKLVQSQRGGYCFEHGRLFLDALEALGFEARPLLARVWLGGGDEVPPQTHTLALVTIDGQQWIADAGFGAAYSPPMPLSDGEEADAPDGARFRLARDPVFGWMLSRNGDPATTDGRIDAAAEGRGWQRQCSFTLDPVYPNDLILANHWVSTAAESRFVQHRIVSGVLPHGFAGLTDTRYHRRNGEQATEAEITDPRVYRMRLSMMFGIDLSAEEAAMLVGLQAA